MIRLLDGCCSAGGCSKGYELAARELGLEIEITGVDLHAQPNFPFTFIQADIIEHLKEFGHTYTHIHLSPPCQVHTSMNNINKNIKANGHIDLIAPCRDQVKRLGKPYVMENVIGAPLINPLKLQGSMFGLRVKRERLFETSHFMMQPIAGRRKARVMTTREAGGDLYQITGHSVGTLEEWSHAMGIDWMTKKELAQAIPPAYTHYIGLSFLTW